MWYKNSNVDTDFPTAPGSRDNLKRKIFILMCKEKPEITVKVGLRKMENLYLVMKCFFEHGYNHTPLSANLSYLRVDFIRSSYMLMEKNLSLHTIPPLFEFREVCFSMCLWGPLLFSLHNLKSLNYSF